MYRENERLEIADGVSGVFESTQYPVRAHHTGTLDVSLPIESTTLPFSRRFIPTVDASVAVAM